MSSRLHKGQSLTVEFDGYTSEGLAMGSGPDGYEVQAPGGVVGERAQVVIEHVSPHRPIVWARIETVEQPSPARAREHGKGHSCGGCSWVHLDYVAQLEAKAQWTRDVLRAAGVTDAVLADPPVVPSPRPAGYRNRGKYVVRRQRGLVVLGGYLPRTHRVVSTLGCPVMAPEVDRAARALARLFGRRDVPIYDERSRQGLLRYAGVRSNHRGEILATLVVTDEGDLPWELLAEALAEQVPELVGLTLDFNPEPGNVLFSGRQRSVWGSAEIIDRYGVATVRLSGHGFGQVNREVATALYEHATREALAPLRRAERSPGLVWDLFCGAGALTQTLALTEPAIRVVGVEREPTAVRFAQQAAREAGLTGCSFEVGDANLLFDSGQPEVVVLNPPRTGCRPELLSALAQSQAARVIYVSCSPTSLARDILVLREAGFALASLQGFDMLPMTPHLELVARLER